MSSTKRVVDAHHWVVDGDMSADIESSALSLKYLRRFSMYVECTGTMTGSIDVAASDDGGNTWFPMNMGFANLTGADKTYDVDGSTSKPMIKIAYEHTGGAGTMNVWVSAKEE